MFGINGLNRTVESFVFPKPLEIKGIDGELAKFGCTASSPSNNQTQISSQGLQNLSDGNYAYREVNPSSSQLDSSRYLLFKKSGNFVTGSRFSLRTDGEYCFSGQLQSSSVVNITTASPIFDRYNRGETKYEFGQGKPVDLSNYQKISITKAEEVYPFSTRGLQKCINLFPSLNTSTNNPIPSVPPSSTPVRPTDAIAKYPTNDDFNTFEDKLQGNPESLVKLRGNQAEQRRKFQNEWIDRNPNAAKFLGAWYTGDRYFYVFPATVKGGTCVVTQDANGKLNMQVGTVLNKELRYGGGKGFFWRDRPNIIASRDSGSGSLYPIYATSGMPELSDSMIGDMERQKCITTLPFEADAQYYKERGDKFAKLDNKDEAISNYRKALELFRKQNQLAQVRNIEAQIAKLGGNNTNTSLTSTGIVYRSANELGLAQFTGTDKKLITAYENLRRASQGKYSIPVPTGNIDFLKKPIATLRPLDCKEIGFSCDQQEITFADYLELRQKIVKQQEVYNDATNVNDKFVIYVEKLERDTRNGGKNTYKRIIASNSIWNDAVSKSQTQIQLSGLERTGIVLTQTGNDLIDFSASIFKTSAKAIATLAQVEEIAKSISGITPDDVNRYAGAANYILTVQSNLQDAGQAFLNADSTKLNDIFLKTSQNTIEFINLQDSRLSSSGNVIKVYQSAKEFIDLDKLLRQSQLLRNLDGFDKFYLAAAQMSKGMEIAVGGLSIPLSTGKADSFIKKVDVANIILFDALQFSYKNDFRRRYARLLDRYNRNQILIIGMQSYFDTAATEVGNYLLEARTDVVNRRQDGLINVSTQGIIYPP